jgi:hypothetical protein
MEAPRLTPAPDGRREPRANVAWRGRVVVPPNRMLEVRLRDISNLGVGFISHDPIPAHVPLVLSMDVPKPDDPKQAYLVAAQFTATNVVLQGHDYRIGATWILEPAARELIKHWVLKILHG